jgi:hypothetical protein
MMQRIRRPFYIIGHNPNTLEEAGEYLQLGANALEPDIIIKDNQFYVSHSHPLFYKDVLTLDAYLEGLKKLISEHNYNLALLIFDMKDTDFDINDFISIVKTNFKGGKCDGVAILMTHSDDHKFLCRYNGAYPNVGIGVDESNTPPSELNEIFKKAGQKNFSYSDGITTFLTKPGVYKNIREALECRNKNEPDSFKLIYTWALTLEGSMSKYLDVYIDGMFVDPPSVQQLKGLVCAAPYNEVYTLAQNGYNPFTAAPIPKYTLAVKTGNQLFAGTDACFLFTLKNAEGIALKSLPFNGSLTGALERDSITYIPVEGSDLGAIKSVTVEALTEDINSDWLPESIRVESRMLDQCVEFIFDHGGQWVSSKGAAVTVSRRSGTDR